MHGGAVGTKTCLSCEIANGTRTPLGGKLVETPYFNAHQDIAYPIPGLVILASQRHFFCLDEMTDEEANDYLRLLRKIRKAQRSIGIEKVYYFYNEDTTHHFHMWMVPRYEWMQQFGRSVESLRPVLLHARDHLNNPENIKKASETIMKLRNQLQ